MLFNSIDFAVFLPIVFAVYWALNKRGIAGQNIWLLFASSVFYGWWDPRFLVLVYFSAGLDYAIGLALARNEVPKERKRLLTVSLVGNLGLLGVFKYYDFFVTSFAAGFSFFGEAIEPRTLGLVLPVGISFYTFQSMSYTIDVYRKQLEPTKNVVAFGAYVLFFPQLVAGPIERATALIPQFLKPRRFDTTIAADGLRQILWGLFKKVAVADQCAPIVDSIFGDSSGVSSSTLVFGAILFTLQIYGDFSGYSDIAIGSAKLFGFTLMRNFAFPFFSRDIAEFWRRWHISLNTWFRDYLYIPLGGSKGNLAFRIRNTLIIFLVSGFWHGANWTFIAWGALNALYFLPMMVFERNRVNLGPIAEGRLLPSIKEASGMFLTFTLTVVAFVFFRANTIHDAALYLRNTLRPSLFTIPEQLSVPILLMIALMFVTEWIQRHSMHGLAIEWLPRPVRWAVYIPLALLVGSMSGEKVSFIYFQF